jgi:hypothetical protein
MTTKPIFMSAPRPNARLTPEDTKRLIDASADLGFARAIREEVKVVAPPPPKPKPALQSPPPAKARSAVHADATQTLRLDVPQALWTALKLESVHRRVTVKYLMLEALHKAGYAVDLENVPEDGRRLR